MTYVTKRFVDSKCEQCKGKYWDDNPAIRQKRVREAFGRILPNNCVDNEIGGCKCPYHK